MSITGIAEVEIQLGGSITTHPTYILRDSPFDLIIGVDLEKVGKFSIDHNRDTAEIEGKTVALGDSQEPTPCLVKVLETTRLPSRSEVRLVGKLTVNHTDPILLDVPRSTQTLQDVLVARIVATPDDQTIPLRVLNLSEESNTLYGGTTLGQAEFFEEIDQPPPPAPLDMSETEFVNQFPWPETLEKEKLNGLQQLVLKYHSVFSKHATD